MHLSVDLGPNYRWSNRHGFRINRCLVLLLALPRWKDKYGALIDVWINVLISKKQKYIDSYLWR